MKYVVTDEDCVRALTAYDTLRWTKNDCIPMGIDRMRAALEAFAQTLGEPAGVPDGYVLVPVEPTEEMQIAGARHLIDGSAGESYADEASRVFKAMLSAAPHHPTTEKGCE